MEDKKLVLKCIKFGIFGGLFLVVAPTVLYISLMGLSIPLFLGTACLVSYTVIGILITAYESKNYYKGDPRVHKWVADLFLLVGILAFVPIFIRLLGYIPFLAMFYLDMTNLFSLEMSLLRIYFYGYGVLESCRLLEALGTLTVFKILKNSAKRSSFCGFYSENLRTEDLKETRTCKVKNGQS